MAPPVLKRALSQHFGFEQKKTAVPGITYRKINIDKAGSVGNFDIAVP